VCLSFVGAFISSLSAPLVFSELTYGFDPEFGIFGWMREENVVYTFFVMGLVSGCLTFTMYALCLKYFSAVILGNIFLFEPITC
jgi:drug/metabolite transporter (DMT)-like permease